MQPAILILEDDADRSRRFTTVARDLNLGVHIYHDAHEFIDQLELVQPGCVLFSLDCDLIPPDGSEIWGDGEMVARHLAAHPPIAPVIVHSSNRDGAWRMMSDLTGGGWQVERVAPIGADWIETVWRMSVATLIAKRLSH